MKEKYLWLIPNIIFLILLNLISYLIILWTHRNAVLYPYTDFPDPRITDKISIQTLQAYLLLTPFGIVLSIAASLLSSACFCRHSWSNRVIKWIGFGFITLSVVSMIYCTYRFLELWSIGVSLSENCWSQRHC